MCELRIAKKSANLWQVKIKKGSANCELRKKARTSVSDSNLWKSELRIAKKSAKNKKVRHFRDCHFGMRKRSCVSIKSGTKKVRHFRNHPLALCSLIMKIRRRGRKSKEKMIKESNSESERKRESVKEKIITWKCSKDGALFQREGLKHSFLRI